MPTEQATQPSQATAQNIQPLIGLFGLKDRIAAIDTDSAGSDGLLPRKEITSIVRDAANVPNPSRFGSASSNHEYALRSAEELILQVARVNQSYAMRLSIELYPDSYRILSPSERSDLAFTFAPRSDLNDFCG